MGVKETNDEVKARLAKWRKYRESLFAETTAAIKGMGFDSATWKVLAGANEWGNTEVTLTRGGETREFRITVDYETERSASWRGTPTPYPRVKIDAVSPRRTLAPVSRYVNGEKKWTLVKGESVAKVLVKAFDQKLATEAADKQRNAEEAEQNAIAANVNKVAGCEVCSVVSHGYGFRSRYKAEVTLLELDEATLVSLVKCLRENKLLSVLRRGKD